MQTPIDLLIKARWIIPVEPANVVLENHAIAINKGRIVAILQQSEADTIFFLSRQKIWQITSSFRALSTCIPMQQ